MYDKKWTDRGCIIVENTNSYHLEIGYSMKLNDLKVGQVANIVNLNALTNEVRKKLMIMGVLPNTQVTLIRKAPMGDPLQIEVRGVSLAIRGQVAAAIEIGDIQ